MMIFIGWVLFSIIPAVIASNRGRSAPGWFFLSLAMSPLFAGILVACLRPIEPEFDIDMRKCPLCAELVRREAKICRYCQSELSLEEMMPVQPAIHAIRVASKPDRCQKCKGAITALSDHIYCCRQCGAEYRE